MGLAAALFAACLAVVAAAQSTPEEEPPRLPTSDIVAFMRLKLNHAQKVLEGIALEDFTMIEKHSQRMSLLAQDENWMVMETPEYAHHSADFRRAADNITAMAREKNLDGATDGYIALTKNCVSCHKYTRGVRMAGLGTMTR